MTSCISRSPQVRDALVKLVPLEAGQLLARDLALPGGPPLFCGRAQVVPDQRERGEDLPSVTRRKLVPPGGLQHRDLARLEGSHLDIPSDRPLLGVEDVEEGGKVNDPFPSAQRTRRYPFGAG